MDRTAKRRHEINTKKKHLHTQPIKRMNVGRSEKWVSAMQLING